MKSNLTTFTFLLLHVAVLGQKIKGPIKNPMVHDLRIASSGMKTRNNQLINSNMKAYKDYKTLQVTLHERVAYVTINHPPLNILDGKLMTDLHNFASEVKGDVNVRVIVLQSADKDFFIPHGDMNFVNDIASFTNLAKDYEGDGQLNPMQKLHEQWRTLPQVTIAKLNGFARGGGAELASALDMRFGAKGKMGLAQMEVLTGIIPGAGGTVYLPKLVGRARAMEIILGADLFDADLAERYGWINRAIPATEIDEFVSKLAERIARLDNEVIAATKSAVNATMGIQTQGLVEENVLLGLLFSGENASRKTRAALEAGAQTRAGEKRLETLLNNIK